MTDGKFYIDLTLYIFDLALVRLIFLEVIIFFSGLTVGPTYRHRVGSLSWYTYQATTHILRTIILGMFLTTKFGFRDYSRTTST